MVVMVLVLVRGLSGPSQNCFRGVFEQLGPGVVAILRLRLESRDTARQLLDY